MDILTKTVSEKFNSNVISNIVNKKSKFTNPIVKNISFGAPTTKGESYLSLVTRFSIEICEAGSDKETETIPIIVKSFPSNLARKETFRSVDFFENEILFYNKVWPCLDAFQKSKNVQNPLDIVPECLSAFTDGKNDFIALTDLCYSKYGGLPRNTSLNFEQTIEIIRTFGKFHAISLALNDQKPDEFKKIISTLQETYFDEKFRSWYTPVMNKLLPVLRDSIEKELSKEYLDKFEELIKRDIYKECCKICKNHTVLCGVTHGDCWAPNFLVKTTETNQFDVKIIDYQLTRCAPVVTDLTFFLYICVDPVIRDKNWDELIKIYSNSVSEYLNELGSNPRIINVDIVEDAMKKIGMFTFLMGTEAIIMSAAEEIADIDEIQEVTTLDNVWIIKPMSNVNNRKKVAGFFKHLVDGNYV
ncbi:uncharacterized protein [Onthophagus taurus]|uniref:uncharacterized protein isoform X2 n=1 Tax=Onthophagus taurus TaxID=166361 RepID=UPI0039BE790F